MRNQKQKDYGMNSFGVNKEDVISPNFYKLCSKFILNEPVGTDVNLHTVLSLTIVIFRINKQTKIELRKIAGQELLNKQ